MPVLQRIRTDTRYPMAYFVSCAATCFELLGPCHPDPNGISAGRSPCPCAGFSETRLAHHTLRGFGARPPGASTGIRAQSI